MWPNRHSGSHLALAVRACLIGAILPAAALAAPGSADRVADLPLWEAGLGLAAVSFPDYRGSDRQKAYMLPLPYLIYRGDVLQVDRDGLRGLLFESPRFETTLSASGTVPTRSHDEGARTGMPDLDPILEVGISMNWEAFSNESVRVRIRMPVRAAIASDFRSVDHVGWRLEPVLNIESVERPRRWALSFSTGPSIADRRYHAHFYSVSARHVTSTRPEYHAKGGYSGWTVISSASRRFDRTWVGAFLRYDNLNSAQFEDSPLIENRHAFMAGVGVAWLLGQSRLTAPVGR